MNAAVPARLLSILPPSWRQALRSPFAPLVIGLALLLLLVGLIVFTTERRGAERMGVMETLETRALLWQTLSALQDLETAQRGYIITADRAYLGPFERASARIGALRESLLARIETHPQLAPHLPILDQAIDAKIDELRATIGLVEQGRRSEAMGLVETDVGRAYMDTARAQIALMLEAERLDLERRQTAVALAGAQLLSVVVVTALGVIALGLLTLRAARRAHLRIAQSRDAAEAAFQRLQVEVASRESAEAQVRQMQKMESLGQLTGGVAHDFNNMLAAIMSALALTKRRLARGEQDIAILLDAAEDAARRAATLTSRLLAFSRRQALQPETLDANRLVSGMSELLRRTLGERVDVETVLAGGLWRTYADPGQPENAILNLCVNARDAMPDGGKLTIETANAHLDDAYAAGHAEVQPGQYVMLAVTDSGVGMPPEVAAQAFDPFFTTKAPGQGTGLGLSQVFGFVKQSGGHVKIYSEPGQGTTLKMYLPRSLRADEPAARQVEAAPKGAQPGEIVLVVEDEERVRLMSVAALRELGYTVIHADGPNTALALLEQHPNITLLFTDIVMPGMNGRALSEAARTKLPQLKVLYTTGYTRNAIVHNGVLDAGALLLMKPFTLEQLDAKVREAIEQDD